MNANGERKCCLSNQITAAARMAYSALNQTSVGTPYKRSETALTLIQWGTFLTMLTYVMSNKTNATANASVQRLLRGSSATFGSLEASACMATATPMPFRNP